MHEHFYELTPGEHLSGVDGHLLVLVLDGTDISGSLADYCERRVLRLSDRAEFHMAFVKAEDFPLLVRGAPELPALFHFVSDVERNRSFGLDDCLDFFKEFILNNMRQ